MERAMSRDGIHVNDRQLACARINSVEGQDYLVRACSPAARTLVLAPNENAPRRRLWHARPITRG